MKKKYIIPFIIALFVLVGALVYVFFNGSDSIYGNYGKLYITEVCATNFSIIKDEDGDYSDYIEIYNGYGFDVNLEGYYLSDKQFSTSKWSFPNVTIKSGEYMLIYASSKNKYDKELHTSFKLKGSGEVVTLTDSDGVIVSKIKYEQTGYNTSYGYDNYKYVYYYNPSPGEKNTGKTSRSPISFNEDNITIKVTEYITDNRIAYDSEGDYTSMIELYNYGKKDLSLKGFFISDSETKLSKYVLPDINIKSKDYVVIYLSDKNKYSNNEIHANFKIKGGEKFIISSLHGKLIDEVEILDLPLNTSYGLNEEDKWCYYPSPTFGYKNTTKCFTKLGGNSE